MRVCHTNLVYTIRIFVIARHSNASLVFNILIYNNVYLFVLYFDNVAEQTNTEMPIFEYISHFVM